MIPVSTTHTVSQAALYLGFTQFRFLEGQVGADRAIDQQVPNFLFPLQKLDRFWTNSGRFFRAVFGTGIAGAMLGLVGLMPGARTASGTLGFQMIL